MIECLPCEYIRPVAQPLPSS